MNWLTIILIIKELADCVERVLRGGQPKPPVQFVARPKRRSGVLAKKPPNSPGDATA